jgi:hypothetical protein
MHSKDGRHVLRIGFWASLLALLGAVGYFLSALLQISGVLNDLQDAVLAFGSSLLMPVPFLLAMLALHAQAPIDRQFWSLAAVAFAVVYTTYNTLNYVVQLVTVLPAGYTWNLENQAGTQGPLTDSAEPDPALAVLGHRRARLHLPQHRDAFRGASVRSHRPSALDPAGLPR